MKDHFGMGSAQLAFQGAGSIPFAYQRYCLERDGKALKKVEYGMISTILGCLRLLLSHIELGLGPSI